MAREPTLKQLKWVYYYGISGNATEAAELAGYDTENRHNLANIGQKNKKNPILQALIEESEISPLIADRFERQAFWTKVMRDTDEFTSMKLQASRLLGQCQGDFFISKEKKEDAPGVLVVPATDDWRKDLKTIDLR